MTGETEGFSPIAAFLQFAELGAEWVMWVLIALGFFAIVLLFERLRLYLRTRHIPTRGSARRGSRPAPPPAPGRVDAAQVSYARSPRVARDVSSRSLPVDRHGVVHFPEPSWGSPPWLHTKSPTFMASHRSADGHDLSPIRRPA